MTCNIIKNNIDYSCGTLQYSTEQKYRLTYMYVQLQNIILICHVHNYKL